MYSADVILRRRLSQIDTFIEDSLLEQVIIESMHEYADQFRKPEKRTIESLLIGCSEEFKPALKKWLEYKAEKNERYKPIGLKTLVKKINSFKGSCEELDTIIEDSMYRNYSGLFLDTKTHNGKSTKQTRIENFEQGFREQFAGKDLSANDGF